MLNNAHILEDLRIPPANRLEALKGDRKGQHSIRINDQWRIWLQVEERKLQRGRNRRLPLTRSASWPN